MLLRLFLLFFLCGSTVTQTGFWHFTSQPPTQGIHTTTVAMKELSPLQLVANPDYPVAAGQRVHLHCTASSRPDSVTWTWQRLKNHTWQEVGNGMDLILTEPEQSGLYRCHAMDPFKQKRVSANHTVYIISVHVTVGESIGIAAFVLSLVALIIIFAILGWLICQRIDNTFTTTSTLDKGFPGPEKSPKGGFPQTDSDRDVYINYTSNNEAYTDLDRANRDDDHVYSGLS